MPDLGTHVTIAWMAGRAAALAAPSLGQRVLPLAPFLFGSALPDLLSRVPHLVLRSQMAGRLTFGLHTPLCLLLASLALSFLFEERGRARIFAAIFGGACVHCLADFFQIIHPGSYRWLFPVAHWSPQIEIVPDYGTILYLPFLLAFAIALEILHAARSRERERSGG